jgi:hypothetical protein
VADKRLSKPEEKERWSDNSHEMLDLTDKSRLPVQNEQREKHKATARVMIR